MEADFPAAHSMDTNWFAVDKDGQVAFFVSDENGSVPNGASEVDVEGLLRALGGKPSEVGFASFLAELASRGLHVYEDASEWFSGPYQRTHRPKKPLHVDQLPPQLRAEVKAVRFDDLRFEDKKRLQPCDHAEGYAWGGVYLSEDGKTVRAIPGHEKQYREAVELMRQQSPEDFKKFHFEGLDEKKPPKGRRRAKGDDAPGP